jgi:hypothetical protein
MGLGYIKESANHAVKFLIASNAPLRIQLNVTFAIIMLQTLTQRENVQSAEPIWAGNQMAKVDASAMT